MTDEERTALYARLTREHLEKPHPGTEGGRLRIHVAVHAVVETQLIEEDPVEVQLTLDRLVAEGLARHDAIHAIGDVASEEVVACLSGKGRYDEQRYVERLRALTPKPT